jgi:hypothetical protein
MNKYIQFVAAIAMVCTGALANARTAVNASRYSCSQLNQLIDSKGYMDLFSGRGVVYRVYSEARLTQGLINSCYNQGAQFQAVPVRSHDSSVCYAGVVCMQYAPSYTTPQYSSSQHSSGGGSYFGPGRHTPCNGYYSSNGVYHSGDPK